MRHAGIPTSQAGAPGRSGPATRTIALTFDDLPASQGSDEIDHVTALNSRIVSALQAHRAPAVGFVNEGKLAMDERRDVNNTPIEKYEQDILDGEPVTLDLMGQPKLTAEPDPPMWVIDLYRQR